MNRRAFRTFFWNRSVLYKVNELASEKVTNRVASNAILLPLSLSNVCPMLQRRRVIKVSEGFLMFVVFLNIIFI